MPTIARGNLEEVYVPSDSSVTITPGAGGYVKAGFAVRQGMPAVPPREIRAATTLSVSGGTTLFLEAVNTDATYTSPASVDGTLRRRPMIQPQMIPQATAYGTNAATGCTLTQTAPVGTNDPRPLLVTVETSGTGRPFFAYTATGLDTTQFYAVVADVTQIVRAPGSAWGAWFGFTAAPSEASPALNVGWLQGNPNLGLNGFVFRPSSSSMILRVGIGGDGTATFTAGDRLAIASVGMYRVDGLTSALPPFSFSPLGPVGYDPVPQARHAGSCVLAVGDSWSNDSTDWPGLLSTTHQREVIASAIAGHTLSQMLARVQSFFGDTSRLYWPNQNAPGMAWICGGLNDRISLNATAPQIIAGAQAIIDYLQARGLRVGIIIQTDCTDSTHYTATRAQVWNRWANWVMSSGLPYVDSRTVLQNADGTANTTNMLSETAAWIHPSAAGHAALAALVDTETRRVDMTGAIGSGRWVA